MKRVTWTGMLVVLAVGAVAPARAQVGHDLFQQALVKERVEGNLEGAIQLYHRIVREHAGDHALAAKALVQIGRAYEKLGSTEAQKAYERVLRDYADQRDQVTVARRRLAALTRPPSSASGIVVRQVWAGPEVDIFGAPFPDGRYLSFVDWNTGDLAVRDLRSGQTQHVTHKGSWTESTAYAEFSVVSPNGKQLAYTWFDEERVHDLRVVDVDGSSPARVLLRNEELEIVRPAAWSADGASILVLLTRKDRTNQIAMVSVAGGRLRILKTLDWRQPQKMSLSPDGRHIAYDFPPDEESEQRDIFLLAADGSSETPLIEHPGDDLFPVWTPDATRIVFLSDRAGSWDLWAVPVTEGTPRGAPEMAKADIGRVVPMEFTQKGSYYYGMVTGMSDVFVASLDPATGKLIEAPHRASERVVGRNVSPAWSPDGSYLAYVSYRGLLTAPLNEASGTVVIRSIDTGEERELRTRITSYSALRPRWSPDGGSLLLVGHDRKGRQGVYEIDANTGDVTTLLHNDGVLGAKWSPDGRAIYYAGTEDAAQTQFVIRRRDLETGLEREAYRSSRVSWTALSPDGELIAVQSFDPTTQSSGILVVPSGGGEPRAVYEGPMSYNGGLAWTPDGRRILFSVGRPPADSTVAGLELERELWQVAVDNGEAQRFDLAMGNLRQMTLHPDGRHIAFTAGERRFEIWVMENLLPELRELENTQ